MDPFLPIIGLVALFLLILFLPIPGARKYKQDMPKGRFHEEEAVLSRRLLKKGSDAHRDYYRRHPQNLEADERARQAPGLLAEGSRYHHRPTFAAARANFKLIDHLALFIEPGEKPSGPKPSGPVETTGQAETTTPAANSRFIRQWLKNTGAHQVGFTALQDYHLYSHKGRGPGRGEPVQKRHKHAIAITVEMDHAMIQAAPKGSAVMESSEQYLQSGVLALKLAAWIRDMGYEATAHIDGNYELICPLVAVDAGLGVIGRMGLLMTPRLGPRVRIAVVTTSMPVQHGPSRPEPSTLHFCNLCTKCALNCPAAAIPDEPREISNGSLRWQINSEKCYHFWTTSGTDCGRCMTVCPFSHPDNAFHRFIRWGIKNNLVFRHLAVKLDDVFYGKRPGIRPLPGWTELRN